MDEKRLRGEKEHTITQGEIDAWKRGDKDAARSKLLKASREVTVDKAIKLIKMYAELGDIHYLSTRFDVTPDESRRILAVFEIFSIEDAKKACREGVVAEFEDAKAMNREEREAIQRSDHAEAEKRHLAKQKERESEVTIKDPEVIDESIQERAAEAQRKNKEDQLRQLIAEGLNTKKTSGFRIPLGLTTQFKQLIPHGVSQLQRRFGGTRNDIVEEIKRLAPEIDTGMLRP